MPPGKNLDGWWTILRSGMWRLYYQLSPEGRKRYYDEMLPLLHDTKLEVLGERDDYAYYLVYLGTKPHGRGRGYARKLLENMIERVSLAKVPNFQAIATHIFSTTDR
jgi:ribosomal protein S18 acetylase RimI-like enzyme